MGKNYLITGVTGFVGRFILKRLLKDDPENYLYVLVRKEKGKSVQDRVSGLIREMFAPDGTDFFNRRVRPLEGDVTKDRLGMSDEDYASVISKSDVIFHAAASIKFNLELDDAFGINTEGTQHIVKLASDCLVRGRLKNIYHISTAYVSGRKCSDGRERVFANTYERSKYESELVLNRAIQKGFPVTIFRPSIISGDSVTGEITTNNIIYKFLAMLSRQSLAALPGPTTLNIIPLNNFLDMMFEIIGKPGSVGHTFNITNPHNVSFTDLISYACQTLSVRVPEFIPLQHKHLLPVKTLNQIEPFMPYFEDEHTFDLVKTTHTLGKDKITVDDVISSMERIVAYCHQRRMLRMYPVKESMI